jgi:hypothetical protein
VKQIPVSKYLTPETINSVIKRQCSFHKPPTRIITANSSGEKKEPMTREI